MFLNHFKMMDHPFQEAPPLDWVLNDHRFDQAMARLDYFAKQGSLALLTGQTGVGKSTLLRLFIQKLPKNRYHPVYLHFTGVNAIALLRLIVTHLGEAPKRGKDALFMQIYDSISKANLTSILIIDEAHLLDLNALTSLRLLISSAVDTSLPLKMLLCGQEPLARLLAQTSLRDLLNRTSVRSHLAPLTREQTASYIDYRMQAAGSHEKIFDPEAKALIHDYATGIPRLINNIATACLLNAAARKIHKINHDLVTNTMTEIHLP
jgi:general secretion pathway protein A